jgi:lipopolysaccharide transport system ATP-binding protein
MLSNQIAIQVENLSKCYEIYKEPQDRLKQSIIPRLRVLAGKPPKNYYHEFWALRGVSFDVKKGETVGIIGRNGSGKSTLLQLICGTLTPTSGAVVTSGRIAALLELGSGFNPEFTGRENVYLNGAILGLSQEEIDSRFDDIAAFADIGEFIDQAVKTYSSGMLVRLAFSVNVMSQPEIMIVDEALAVGDMNFQSKCMTALKRKQESGTTVLYVSHDVGSVKSLCSRGIHLEHGQVKNIGVAADVAAGYIRMMREEMNENQRMMREKLNDDQQSLNSVFQSTPKIKENREVTSQPLQQWVLKTSEEFDHRVSQFRYGTGEARITYVELLDMDDEPIDLVEFNQKVKIRIFFEAYEQKILSVNFAVRDDKKNNITGSNLRLIDQPFLNVHPGDCFQVDYSIQLPLTEGIYSIQTTLTESVVLDETANFVDVIEDAVVFRVSRWEKSRLWHRVFLFPSVEIKTKSQENNPAQ